MRRPVRNKAIVGNRLNAPGAQFTTSKPLLALISLSKIWLKYWLLCMSYSIAA